MTSYLVVEPAYGRDYKSKQEVLADWNAGQDFLVQPGPGQRGGYLNKDDKPDGVSLQVRYAKLTKVMILR